MTAQSNPGVAVYTGNARLWQDANVIEAPSIQFDRENRSVIAQGTPTNPVQTILIQAHDQSQSREPQGKPATANAKQGANANSKEERKPMSPAADSGPLTITSAQLTYTDSERKAHYQGSVVAKGTDFTATCQALDVCLRARGETQPMKSGQLDRMVAQGDVLVLQPNRHAEGQRLVYTAADDKFVLTGGPPSIFDAEQGKITGVSLTFFRHDDRVLVEGEASSPVVTETRVAR